MRRLIFAGVAILLLDFCGLVLAGGAYTAPRDLPEEALDLKFLQERPGTEVDLLIERFRFEMIQRLSTDGKKRITPQEVDELWRNLFPGFVTESRILFFTLSSPEERFKLDLFLFQLAVMLDRGDIIHQVACRWQGQARAVLALTAGSELRTFYRAHGLTRELPVGLRNLLMALTLSEDSRCAELAGKILADVPVVQGMEIRTDSQPIVLLRFRTLWQYRPLFWPGAFLVRPHRVPYPMLKRYQGLWEPMNPPAAAAPGP